MKISEALNGELFLLIGRFHPGMSPRDSSLVRKASELYSLIHNLKPINGRSLDQRRRKLGLRQEDLAALCRVSPVTIANWEAGDAPAWVGPMLDALEERRRDEERRDYLGINEAPEA